MDARKYNLKMCALKFLKNHSNNFSKKMCHMKNLKKTIVTIFQKNVLYEKF